LDIAYYNRGIVKAALGQHFTAIRDFDKAIVLNSDYTDAYYHRGKAMHNLGSIFEAMQDFLTALRHAKQKDNMDLKSEIENTMQQLGYPLS
jgi:tetratricopeptide (TPR) repeat protein